jgi:hypothetical protein
MFTCEPWPDDLTPERVRAGGELIEVTRVQMTEAGRGRTPMSFRARASSRKL